MEQRIRMKQKSEKAWGMYLKQNKVYLLKHRVGKEEG